MAALSMPQIKHLKAANGVQIFRLPLRVFPGYVGYAHLVDCGGSLALVDVGSGFGSSDADLIEGLEAVHDQFGIPVSIDRIRLIIITHGHIDHFGGLRHLKKLAPQARIAAHELTVPVLLNHHERVLVTGRAMEDFLCRAGVPEECLLGLLNLFMVSKQAFPRWRVDITLRDGDLVSDAFRVVHVPGHAPGLIMLQAADVLLTADHILPDTSVALAPESIMPYTGVGHYVESLNKALRLEEVRLAAGGHEAVMNDFYPVAERTLAAALGKVEQVLDQYDQPRTVYQVARQIYGQMDGYGALLKLEQTGARVEYLHQRGLLVIDNLEALEADHRTALYYRRA
jgi:glyoxylase-like metal-dependent hydrolase (beta-lactamase superfamily II)